MNNNEEEYHFGCWRIRADMLASIRRYVEQGIRPCDFLTAIICDEPLSVIATLGDTDNLKNLMAFVSYFYNEVPTRAWHSRENMEAWIASKSQARNN